MRSVLHLVVFSIFMMTAFVPVKPMLAQKLVDPSVVAPEFREAAEKRRAEQVKMIRCQRKAEEAAAKNHFPEAAVYTPKPALGESVGASALWQLICAAQALRTQQLPPLLHVPADCGLTSARVPSEKDWHRAVVTTCGLNQQVAALALQLKSISTDR